MGSRLFQQQDNKSSVQKFGHPSESVLWKISEPANAFCCGCEPVCSWLMKFQPLFLQITLNSQIFLGCPAHTACLRSMHHRFLVMPRWEDCFFVLIAETRRFLLSLSWPAAEFSNIPSVFAMLPATLFCTSQLMFNFFPAFLSLWNKRFAAGAGFTSFHFKKMQFSWMFACNCKKPGVV